ncbi:MAG: PAC2 family protein [Acidimicrobiales bacterium]
MDHVRWHDHPPLRRPVLVAAFEGWNDAGDAASAAASYLSERWGAKCFASIDPEDFFDFSSTRPEVRLSGGITREILWPTNEFLAASLPDAPGDVVLLLGNEPQLRWRTFTDQVVAVAQALDVSLVVTLGALLADVPHTRPVKITGTAGDEDLVARLGLTRSTYEGPTGIVGVLHDACNRAGVPSASLWAAVPHYVAATPSPKASLALIERASLLLSAPVIAADLATRALDYERQVSEIVASDDDVAAYVKRLESSVDEDDLAAMADRELPTADSIAAEVERYLREGA